jgi:hypothetical protein
LQSGRGGPAVEWLVHWERNLRAAGYFLRAFRDKGCGDPCAAVAAFPASRGNLHYWCSKISLLQRIYDELIKGGILVYSPPG